MRVGARRCVFTCVFANKRVQAWFPFEHLFDVAVYLFISPACEGPSSAVRATADRARVALSAIHQPVAFLTDEPVTLAPYITHQLETEAVFFLEGGRLCPRRCRATGRAPASSPPCLFITTLPGRVWVRSAGLSPARRVYHCTQSTTI